MSSTHHIIPWVENKIRTLNVIGEVEQGQLLNISGCKADASKGIKAHYIAGASASGSSTMITCMSVYQNVVLGNVVIAKAKTEDNVYLGDEGEYTIDKPLSGIVQVVGVTRPDGLAQVNLEYAPAHYALDKS